MKRAAILGCGSGGMTMAVDLGMKGFKVNLFDFPEYDKNLRVVEEKVGGERPALIDPYLPRGFQLGHE